MHSVSITLCFIFFSLQALAQRENQINQHKYIITITGEDLSNYKPNPPRNFQSKPLNNSLKNEASNKESSKNKKTETCYPITEATTRNKKNEILEVEKPESAKICFSCLTKYRKNQNWLNSVHDYENSETDGKSYTSYESSPKKEDKIESSITIFHQEESFIWNSDYYSSSDGNQGNGNYTYLLTQYDLDQKDSLSSAWGLAISNEISGGLISVFVKSPTTGVLAFSNESGDLVVNAMIDLSNAPRARHWRTGEYSGIPYLDHSCQ